MEENGCWMQEDSASDLANPNIVELVFFGFVCSLHRTSLHAIELDGSFREVHTCYTRPETRKNYAFNEPRMRTVYVQIVCRWSGPTRYQTQGDQCQQELLSQRGNVAQCRRIYEVLKVMSNM